MISAFTNKDTAIRRYLNGMGFSVVSIPPNSKGPNGFGWNKPGGYYEPQHVEDAIGFFREHPGWNLGLVHEPSNTAALDIDHNEYSRIAFEALGLDLIELLAAYPTPSIQGSPTKLAKPIFRVPSGASLVAKKLAWPHPDGPDPITGKPRRVTVFELRAGDVQDVLPPSRHPLGVNYNWHVSPDECPIAELPPEILDLWEHWSDYEHDLLSACPWEKPKPKQPPKLQRHQTDKGSNSVIQAFNQAHDMRELLKKCGYKPKGNDRFIAPGSTSGMPGVKIFEDDRVYSHHGSDPLAGSHSHDAFSVYTLLKHGGNVNVAVREAARFLGIEAEGAWDPGVPPIGEEGIMALHCEQTGKDNLDEGEESERPILIGPEQDENQTGIPELCLEIPERLISNAPGIMSTYIEWYLDSARNPEPVYAFSSCIAFATAVIGIRRYLTDTYLNTISITLGPTESGKEAIVRMLSRALTQVKNLACIPSLERAFASPQGAWWALAKNGPTLLFDTELGKLLEDAQRPGQNQGLVTELLRLHDAVLYEDVPPIRYSLRQKKNVEEMPSLQNPFLSVHGTATPMFYAKAKALAAEDGTLNRFLILNCEGNAKARDGENAKPLPGAIVTFARELNKPTQELKWEPGAQKYQRERIDALKEERNSAPGTWGRFGIRSSRLALLSCVCRSDTVVRKTTDMEWACDIVEHSNRIATLKFQEYGGLAASESEALTRSIQAAFKHPMAKKNKGVINRRLLSRYCWAWRKADLLLRERAVSHMEKAREIIPCNGGWKLGDK